jgi:hypothetical protein
MQIPIISGIYSDPAGDWRTKYPRNLCPVIKGTGVSEGYLRPADGIAEISTMGARARGAIIWNDTVHVVTGSTIGYLTPSGSWSEYTAGDVIGDFGHVKLAIGPDRLAIWTERYLYYSTGYNNITRVTDPDLGVVFDGCWIDGYFLSTDGTYIVATDINDPMAINPLRYGSAEANPDKILGLDALSGEVYAFGRYTIEVFENVGGSGFPFRRISGAMVSRGVIGKRCYAKIGGTYGFVGGGEGEAPGVYLMGAGASEKISTQEVDERIWASYSGIDPIIYVESRVGGDIEQLLVHLEYETWCFDLRATKAAGVPIWFRLGSENDTYAQREYVVRYPQFLIDKWVACSSFGPKIGRLSRDVTTQWGEPTRWEFSTPIAYNEARGVAVHELELVALPGRRSAAESTITTAYTHDGTTWSPETPCASGAPGETQQRIVWRRCGRVKQSRIQRFKGTSDSAVSISRLEARMEPLNG